jgi:hypothetical protein
MAEQTSGADNLGQSTDGSPAATLNAQSFTNTGEIKTVNGDLALVVQSAKAAQDFLQNKQWNLLWRDADLLYQSPRPMTTYENTYLLEPNVQRFTVATVCNSIVPQLCKGLFYDDPPMILRPRKGTSQEVTDAKTTLFSYLLDECKFKIHTKRGMEVMAHQGTGIWKWGYNWKDITTYSRQAAAVKIKSGAQGAEVTDTIPLDEAPKITMKAHTIPVPFFESRPLDKVLVDPLLETPDIRDAGWVVDVHFMDFYQISDLKKSLENAKATAGWTFPADDTMKDLWTKASAVADNLAIENIVHAKGAVHHADDVNQLNQPNPLRRKLEVLEYWDKSRKIMVLNKAHVIYTGDNEFNEIPFLSANWWNRPKAFYGMGLGLIVGQNQRVDQGTINAILKILSFGVNPIYLRRRDANAPTQMIRTQLGKILTVDGETENAYKLMETPKVPSDIWAALKESEQATEASSGADQMLVQGTTSGPRSSMGRTSGGAAIQASASATRLDGPLDNFIEQVFKPFLYILDRLVFTKMSDAAILAVLGKECGPKLIEDFKMQAFHDAVFEYEVLAGSSMSAKRTMAQSMVMLTQILDNPQIQQSLADINEEYIDFKPIIAMWMEASEWKNGQDIIKPMTPAMKQKRDANSAAAQMQAKMQMADQQNDKKFDQKKELQTQQTDDRIKRDLVVAAAKASGLSETVEGEPSEKGIQG